MFTRNPRTTPPPNEIVSPDSATCAADRQLAAIRKYAPSKAQPTSRDGVHVREINALMRRWKPCPKAAG